MSRIDEIRARHERHIEYCEAFDRELEESHEDRLYLLNYIDELEKSHWQPIKQTPNDGRMCLFSIPEKDYPVMNRCDDYWAGAYWLQNATHYMIIEKPVIQPSKGFSYNPGMGKSVLKAQAEKIEKLETEAQCLLDKLSIAEKFIPESKRVEFFSELVTINARYYGKNSNNLKEK